jgi:ABC-type Mn2+/Zn2+ transport system permease subunit
MEAIRSFMDSWPLFAEVYISGSLAALVLSVVGVPVLARDQIFIGAAAAEASTFGLAAGMVILEWLPPLAEEHDHGGPVPDLLLAALAVSFSIGAALLTASPRRETAASREAVTGWVFLTGASLSVLLVSHSPHGMEKVHRLLVSSLIGASTADVVVFAALSALVVAVTLVARDRLLLLTTDPRTAAAAGVNIRAWELAFCVVLGASSGLALRAAGLLYTFGFLVLPGLAARNLCRSAGAVFFAAPALALTAALAGFVAANHYDEPPAQVAVATLCGVVVLSGLWAGIRRRLGGEGA